MQMSMQGGGSGIDQHRPDDDEFHAGLCAQRPQGLLGLVLGQPVGIGRRHGGIVGAERPPWQGGLAIDLDRESLLVGFGRFGRVRLGLALGLAVTCIYESPEVANVS